MFIKQESLNLLKKIILFAGVCLLVYFFLDPYYIFPDGQGYFSYLPSLFYDADVDLYNEFINMKIPVPLALTKTGYISNNWSFGAAFFWAPFYAAAKVLGEVNANPYGRWFWYWINFGTIFYGFLAFALVLDILGTEHLIPEFQIRELSVLSLKYGIIAALAFIGTPMFFYTFCLSSSAHGISAFIVSLFIWYWLNSLEDSGRIHRYILLGLILGMAFMVRPQEALFGIVVLIELAFLLRKMKASVIKYIAVYGASFIVGASPQLVLWKIMYGSFLYAPAKFNLSLKYFALSDVLFSSYHGILFWTPVMFLAFIGLVLGCWQKPKIYIGLLAAFMGQIIVNSCCVAYWEGYSFGLRQMTSSFALVAAGLFGLARFAKYILAFKKSVAIARLNRLITASRAVRILVWSLMFATCLWTLGLIINYYIGLDLLGYVSPQEIWKAQIALPGNMIKFLKQFFSSSRPAFSLWSMLMVAGYIFLFFVRRIKGYMQWDRYILAIGLFTAIIAGFDIMLIKAHFNKSRQYDASSSEFITPQQLDEFFIGQVEQVKEQYKIGSR